MCRRHLAGICARHNTVGEQQWMSSTQRAFFRLPTTQKAGDLVSGFSCLDAFFVRVSRPPISLVRTDRDNRGRRTSNQYPTC